MKRSTLQRKAPMARASFQLARSSFKPRTTAKPRKTTPPKVRDTPRPRIVSTALEEFHRDRVARIGCIALINLRHGRSPAELHHARTYAGGGQKSTEFHVLPICPLHHRLGGVGVALHAGRQTWAKLYGTEEELLIQVLSVLGFEVEPDDLGARTLARFSMPNKCLQMSKRFGRNQRRRARERIAELELRGERMRKVVAERDRDIADLSDHVQYVASVLGHMSTLTQDLHHTSGHDGMQLVGARTFSDLSPNETAMLEIMRCLEIDAVRDAARRNIHAVIHMADNQCAYALSESALRTMTREQL